MKERPILFSSSMVRAILDGKKTQTRRVVKHPINGIHAYKGNLLADWPLSGFLNFDINEAVATFAVQVAVDDEHESSIPCAHGKPGDRLWVRETWRTYSRWDECPCYDDCQCPRTGATIYRADYSCGADEDKWRPSIFMPRDRSRLTLEITGVRVERVQDISEADAWAEGFPDPNGANRQYEDRARYWFRNLWQSINGKREGASWADNPFVWVVEFKRVNGEVAR